MTSPNSRADLIQAINPDLAMAYRSEEEFWRQRNRQLWLSLGDKNICYFHASTRSKRVINNISIIENKEGKPCDEEDQITEAITSYFQSLFTSQPGRRAVDPTISEATNSTLIHDPTPKEIKDAMFSIHADKASGPDRFLARFFHSNWSTVDPAIIKEIQGIITSGILSRTINTTHIRLIPKVKSPKTMVEYRPISLCNVYYKVISKILTRRLHLVLQDLVS